MKRMIRKVGALVIAGSMILAIAACDSGSSSSKKKDKDKDEDDDASVEEIVDAANDFADTLSSGSSKKIFKYVSADADEDLKDFIDDKETLGEDVIDAITATIKYEVDEKSAEIDDDEGSVDITFTMVDWEYLFEDPSDYKTVDDLIDAIGDCDETIDIDLNVEFVNEDDNWVVSEDSIEDVIKKLYGSQVSGYYFEASNIVYDINFNNETAPTVTEIDPTGTEPTGTEPTAALIDPLQVTFSGYWYSTMADYSNVYINTQEIDLDLESEQYYLSEIDCSQIYYVVTFGGKDIYTSGKGEVYGYYGYYESEEYLDDDGYLLPGEYTVTFYSGDTKIYSDTCTVEKIEIADKTVGEVISSFDGKTAAKWLDSNIESIVEVAGWFDYSEYGNAHFLDGQNYPANYWSTLEFTAQLKDGADYSAVPAPLYYTIYCNSTNDFSNVELDAYDSFGICSGPETYTDGTFLEFAHDSFWGVSSDTYYLCIVSKAPDMTDVVAYGVCFIPYDASAYEMDSAVG